MRHGGGWRNVGRALRAMLALAAIITLAALPPASGVAQTDTDAAASRELTRYLLVATSGGSSEPRSVDVLPARLPGDLPLALPTPPGARLVGSAVLYTRMRTTAWDVIYDAPGTAAAVNDFYADVLPALGWDAPPSESRPARGFYPAVMGVAQRGIFCGNGASLLVNTGPTAAGSLYVRVRLDAAGSLCTPAALTAASGGPSATDALPGLAAPSGVPLRLTSGSFTAERAATTATAATTMPAAALEAHYARQLTAAGWMRVDGAMSEGFGAFAWSTWILPGAGDFRGFLSVLDAGDADRRELTVHVLSPTIRVSGGSAGGAMPAPAPAPAPPSTPFPLP